MAFHAARVEKSPQLQRVLAVLERAGANGIDGLALEREANVRAGATRVSELRHNGYEIEARYIRTSESGAKVWRYYLRGRIGQKELF
jgi:hypothetical protein